MYLTCLALGQDLSLVNRHPLTASVGKTKIKGVYNAEADTAHTVDAMSGKLLPAIVVYWFAWATFHPESPVYTAPVATQK